MKKASSAPKKVAKPKSKRRPFPYSKVAKLWAAGKTIPEIAEAIGRVGKGKDRAATVGTTRIIEKIVDVHQDSIKGPANAVRLDIPK